MMILVLLVISAWINYIDRGTLAVAAPVLGPELHMAPQQMGFLLSAFFWTYAGLLPVAGWVVDRYPVKWVYGIGFTVWTLATLLTGFSGGFVTLFACRIILGMGEAVAYPSYSKIFSTQLPESKRGFANALIDAGTKGGPALGTFVGALLVERFGWRYFFLYVGAAGLVWLVPWFLTRVDGESGQVASKARKGGPGYLDIISHRAGIGTCAGLFFLNYSYYFLLTWLPSYLVTERGLSLKEMGVIGSLPWIGCVSSSLFFGWLADRQIHRGAEVGPTRRRYVVIGLLACSSMMLLVTTPDRMIALAMLIGSVTGLGVATSNLWAISQTLAGPETAGRWTGIQNGIGNLGGVTAPIVTGFVVARTGSFFLAFIVASASLALGALCYSFVIGPIRPIFQTPERPEMQPQHSL